MTEPLRSGRREQAKLERRERIYEAALSLFREQGYESTTVDQITRQAGLAKGTFFNYFPTKDAVLRYLGTREIGRLGSVLSMNGNSRGTAIGKLKRLMAALAANLEEDRALVSLIFRKGVTVPDLLAGDAGGFSLQPVASLLIRQAQYNGEVNRQLDPDGLAAALDALYLQQLVRWCESTRPYPLAERLTGIVDLLLLGIGATE
jgi:TetR/AcrR family transcriptional regulator, cholesterol catabolism regulator